MKELYRFTLYKNTEVEIEEEKTVDGELVTVKKKVIDKLPVSLVIKKPSRSEIETIEFVYDKEFHRLTDAGIKPRAMMVKQFIEMGGVFTNDEEKSRKHLAKELAAKVDEFEQLKQEEKKDNDKIAALGQEIIEGEANLRSFASLEETLINNCAETKARNKTINYIIANFSYIDPSTPEKPNQKPYLFFVGDSTEEKLDDRSEKIEAGDSFVLEAVEYFTFLLALWYYGRANTTEDFKRFEKEFKESRNEGSDPGTKE